MIDALLFVEHGAQHGEPLHQLVAQHQAGLLVQLNGALTRGQLAQDEAQVEDLVLIEGERPSTWNQSWRRSIRRLRAASSRLFRRALS